MAGFCNRDCGTEDSRPTFFMQDTNTLKLKIKNLMVESLMLQITADEIGDDQPLFGAGSMGLDSVDALQLVVALDKNFGLKIPDPATAKVVLQNVNTMAEAVQQKLAASTTQHD